MAKFLERLTPTLTKSGSAREDTAPQSDGRMVGAGGSPRAAGTRVSSRVLKRWPSTPWVLPHRGARVREGPPAAVDCPRREAGQRTERPEGGWKPGGSASTFAPATLPTPILRGDDGVASFPSQLRSALSGGLRRMSLARDAFGAVESLVSGAARDLAGRSGEDALAYRDPDYIRATLPAYRRLIDLYFRPKVRGLEHIPSEGPVLLVGNHSGGALIADTFAFAFAFYSYFGSDRPFYQLAHDLVLRIPGLAAGFRRYGTLPASHENAGRALDAGAAVLVYPGGDYESHRPSSESAEVDFGGRSGFVRLALDRGIPIVPVVAIGGQETALFLTRGEWAARTLRLDRLLRLKVLSVQLGPPFGLTVLDLPGRIPLPSQVTVEVLPSFDLRQRFGRNPDEETVSQGITEEMQEALTALAGERDLPVVGKVGARSSRGVAEGYAQPWDGYDRMRVPEIAARLRTEDAAILELVRDYETAQKGRKMVLDAVERELRRPRVRARRAPARR